MCHMSMATMKARLSEFMRPMQQRGEMQMEISLAKFGKMFERHDIFSRQTSDASWVR